MQHNNNTPVHVTMPSLAPLEEYTAILEGVWESGIMTHNGPLVRQLESELCDALEVPNLTVVSNGTVAIQMAIKALELEGEIITTPFTWIATLSAIKWEGCTPVFCDIDPESLNIDPSKIEAAITDRTVAIMPVHVFGNPCQIEEIEAIAKAHGLKVIYDAAHAVGSTYKGKSALAYGDISATSLHATKMLNTAEGGACVAKTPALYEKLKRIRFFGHDDAKDVVEDGFNGKMTEVHAALGLANLKYFEKVLEDRKVKYQTYLESLAGTPGLKFQKFNPDGESNCSYFPVIFDSEDQLVAVVKELSENYNIFARRYFYPSVNTYTKVIPYQKMPVSEDISSRILCLPLFYTLDESQVRMISDILASALS